MRKHERPNSRKKERVKYLEIQDRSHSGYFASDISAVRKQRKHGWNYPDLIVWRISNCLYDTVVGHSYSAANTNQKEVRKRLPAINRILLSFLFFFEINNHCKVILPKDLLTTFDQSRQVICQASKKIGGVIL